MDKKFNKNHEKSAETQESFAKKSFAKIAGIGAIVVAAGTLLTACSSNEKSAKNSADNNAPKTTQSAKNAVSSESESSSENQNGLKISFSEFKSELENAGYTVNSAEITTDDLGEQYYATVTIPNGKTGYVFMDPSGWSINGSTYDELFSADEKSGLFN